MTDEHGIVKMTKMDYSEKRKKAKNPIKIQDLSFRDGHQSIYATRGRTEDMLPMAEMMDEVGFYSMEVWGGATFDTMTRYLNEDPWERIRTLKKYIKKTPFSMLLRGQNLVGYRNYADDVVEIFVERAAANGIDIFRVFDALNDFRNFETAVKVIKKNKKHFQGTICYSLTEQRMGGDVYNIDYYLEKAKQLDAMGADSICIKDMAGLVAPYDAYNLVKALKSITKTPIHLHTHFTSGMGDLALFKAIEAGVDIIDTCMAPYAYRTSHAAVEPLVISLLGTNRDTGFDIKLLNKIDGEMEKITPKYKHLLDNSKTAIIDSNVIIHQTPGGMISNLVSQLRAMGAEDKLEQVYALLPDVRKDLGMVPLVTPTSQIVGIQTVNNVLFDQEKGEYSHITNEVKDLCYGLYGKTTCKINKDVQKKALKEYPRGEKAITARPGDILEPEMPAIKEKAKGIAKDIDDELIVALYPLTGLRFLKWKYGLEEIPEDVKPKTIEEVKALEELIRKAIAGEVVEKPKKDKPENLRGFDVFVDGEYFKVEVAVPEGTAAAPVRNTPVVQRPVTAPAATPARKSAPAPAPTTNLAAGEQAIVAPMPGMIVSYEKKVGDAVKAGETVVVLEAMKMNNNLVAPCDGKISSTPYNSGDSVSKNDVLCIITS
ncbi:MAG TPA: pyruvate carboxylase subunit B [Candidatus Cloacimonadota bacterium]|jgi:pyruvate/oxaloacetate carboxyltransferase/biotin carboxyl carrier protein|nr:pyruvate carboxylase subunit B [Candidatus Cloacimonadales bacterium]HPY97358.1 pyruvate carboxylase subunit B [Candidatus Cloacimonadota bacterium]HQB41849.1 pyruvate carboxylase subunit B [Candidatus Cloacimonadota bacterium]